MMVMEKSHSLTRSYLRPQYLRTISLLIGVVLISGGAGWWLRQIRQSESSAIAPASAQASPLSVKTAIAQQRSVESSRVLTGTVEPIETVTLTSRVMGQIHKLNVQEGDRVKAGEPLVAIDVADIQAQSSHAWAGVHMAQSNYQNAEARLQEAQAQLLEAEAALADARLEQRRMTTLQAEGAVSQQLLDQANTRVQMSQARIQQIKASIRQSQATMNQSQAQVRQAQAQVDQVSANLNYGTITAPFEGIVTQRHTEVGAMAGPGQALVTLESSDRLRFSIEVPESLVTQIQQGQQVSVHLDALNRKVSGTVTQIIPSADPTTRNFTVKVTLETTPAVIPGMFGRLQLAQQKNQSSSRTALMIPQAAIVQQFGITGVYKVMQRPDSQHQAAFQPIVTGKTHGADIEIFSGLTEGDRLVVAPPSNLPEGTTLSID